MTTVSEKLAPAFSLDIIQVAKPCPADWNEMKGDERVRHCRLCEKNVYDLSTLTRSEAEALILQREGRLCVQFYRRVDGTILTADCPVGWRMAVRRRVARGVTALAAMCLALVQLSPLWGKTVRTAPDGPLGRMDRWLHAPQLPILVNPFPANISNIKGDVYIPPPVLAPNSATPAISEDPPAVQ